MNWGMKNRLSRIIKPTKTGRCVMLAVDHGYLFIFDRREDLPWDEKVYEREVRHEGKRIVVLGA